MKREPLVSVIMNCHNGAKYLKDSVESLMSQTYKNWELIFWDNKSFDSSKKIIKKFKDKKVITNELKKNEKLDFTSFLMELIKKKYTINVLLAKIKWFEFDTKYDFNIYRRLINKLK